MSARCSTCGFRHEPKTGYCPQCEQHNVELHIPDIDPIWGEPIDWWCWECIDNYDGPGDEYYEGVAEDVAAKRHQQNQWRIR